MRLISISVLANKMISLKKNFVYSLAYQLLIIILPLITTPYISRVLGADGIGQFSYTQSVATYFSLMAMLGISQHGNRSISEYGANVKKRSSLFWNIYSIQLLTHLVAIAVYILYTFYYNNTILSWLQLITILSSLCDISWFYFGIEHFDITVGRNTIIKIITVILTFTFVKNPSDLWKYTLILILGSLLSQMYLWFFLPKYIFKEKIDIALLMDQVKPILTLFIPVLAYSIYKIMDKIMLGTMSSYTQVGLYENAYKINNIPIGFITAIGNVMLPRMTALVSNGQNLLAKHYIEISFAIINMLSCAMVFGIGGISNNFAVVYYGNEFAACGSLITCLNWTVFFIAWANIMRTQYLIPNKKDNIYVISTISGAIINLIINLILIPQFHALGAAIGTFMAEFTVMLIQLCCIKSELTILQYIVKSWRYFVSGFFMMIILKFIEYYLKMGIKTLIIQIITGTILYLILTFYTSYRKKDEIWNFIICPLSNKFRNKKDEL